VDTLTMKDPEKHRALDPQRAWSLGFVFCLPLPPGS
jgi:hypothetical protein